MNLTLYRSRLLGAALLLSTNAWAGDMTSLFGDTTPAPYVQGSLGRMHESSPSSTGTAMDLNGSANTVNFRLAAGAQLGKYLGAELTYFQLPRSHVDSSTGTAGYKGSAYTVSLTGAVPLRANISAVGRIGLGRSDVDVDAPTTNYASSSRRNLFVWGLGARYPVTSKIDATLDYDNLGAVAKYAQGDTVRASNITVGARFKF